MHWSSIADVKRATNRIFNMVAKGEPDTEHPDYDDIVAHLKPRTKLHPAAKAVDGPCAGQCLPWKRLEPGQANSMLAAAKAWLDANDETLEADVNAMREEITRLLDYLKRRGHDPSRGGAA